MPTVAPGVNLAISPRGKQTRKWAVPLRGSAWPPMHFRLMFAFRLIENERRDDDVKSS